MRTSIFLTILLVSITTATFGQTSLTLKAQYGEARQVSTSRLSLDDGHVPHYGLSAEVFRAVSSKFALGIAPGYMRRGTDFEVGFSNGLVIGPIVTFDANLYLDYFQLPLLAKFETKLAKSITGFGQFGPGFSYLLGGYREVTLAGSGAPRERRNLDFDGIDEELNRFDFGLHHSLGFGYAVGKGKLLVSFDYYLGLLDVDQKNVSENRNWAIGLGYQIGLSKN